LWLGALMFWVGLVVGTILAYWQDFRKK
jgi:hypothetical protein